MPDGSSGSNQDKSKTNISQRNRKLPQPTISDEALAALERHYGGLSQDAPRGDADTASATGFAAMLAHGSVAGAQGVGSSGAMPAIGADSNRRDGGEIPEAKIIAVRPDAPAENHETASSIGGQTADEATTEDGPAPIIYTTTPVEEVPDPQAERISPAVIRPPGTVTRGASRGMPEHYKAFVPILIAMGLAVLAVGIWAVMQMTGGTSSGTGAPSSPGLLTQAAALGIPLGLVMLGLSAFILKRYWKKG
jgi:hypothetical protein